MNSAKPLPSPDNEDKAEPVQSRYVSHQMREIGSYSRSTLRDTEHPNTNPPRKPRPELTQETALSPL